MHGNQRAQIKLMSFFLLLGPVIFHSWTLIGIELGSPLRDVWYIFICACMLGKVGKVSEETTYIKVYFFNGSCLTIHPINRINEALLFPHNSVMAVAELGANMC